VEHLADIIGRYRHCAFSHVRRQANRVADTLANLGVTVEETFAFTKWPPHNTADWVHHVTRDANNDKEAHEGQAPRTHPTCTVEEVNGGVTHHRGHPHQ